MQLQNLSDRQVQETKICISEPFKINQGQYFSSGQVINRHV